MPGHHLLAALTGVGNHPHGHISRSPPQHTSTTVQRVTTLARALVDRRELRVPGERGRNSNTGAPIVITWRKLGRRNQLLWPEYSLCA